MSKERGCSGNSRVASRIVLLGMVNRPLPSHSSNGKVVVINVSLSLAVRVNTPSVTSKRKLSRIGKVVLLLNTLARFCNLPLRAELEIENFIRIYTL